MGGRGWGKRRGGERGGWGGGRGGGGGGGVELLIFSYDALGVISQGKLIKVHAGDTGLFEIICLSDIYDRFERVYMYKQ